MCYTLLSNAISMLRLLPWGCSDVRNPSRGEPACAIVLLTILSLHWDIVHYTCLLVFMCLSALSVRKLISCHLPINTKHLWPMPVPAVVADVQTSCLSPVDR